MKKSCNFRTTIRSSDPLLSEDCSESSIDDVSFQFHPVDKSLSWFSHSSYWFIISILLVSLGHLSQTDITKVFSFPILPIQHRNATHSVDLYIPDIVSEDSYSIIVNSFRRRKLLRSFLHHYSKCEKVHLIYICWSDSEREPETWVLEEFPKARLVRYPKDSLNYRFHPIPALQTEAVLSADDDIRTECKNMDKLHEVWRSTPKLMVGAIPRTGVKAKYHRKYEVSSLGYNIVLTKFSMFHRNYLTSYFKSDYDFIRNRVESIMNCEDIAMNFIIIRESGENPIWVPFDLEDINMGGGIHLSGAHGNHFENRNKCVEDFTTFLFNKTGMPQTRRWKITNV